MDKYPIAEECSKSIERIQNEDGRYDEIINNALEETDLLSNETDVLK